MHLPKFSGAEIGILATSMAVSLVLIIRLWRPSYMAHGLVIKALLTLFLLIPVLGPLLYAFAGAWPDKHGHYPAEVKMIG